MEKIRVIGEERATKDYVQPRPFVDVTLDGSGVACPVCGADKGACTSQDYAGTVGTVPPVPVV